MVLLLHQNEIKNIFELLGTDENSLTYALGWSLENNKILLKNLLKTLFNRTVQFDNFIINLQKYSIGKKGYTDIEILIDEKKTDKKIMIVIEAKKRWNLPDKKQLNKYIERFNEYKGCKKLLVVLSECKKEYAADKLNQFKIPVQLNYLSWGDLTETLNNSERESNNFQRKMLKYLKDYLKMNIIMRDTNSNRVFCVALNSRTPSWSKLSYIDIVEKERKYFYPLGEKRWPPDPPNYIAFRYDGKLQSIHHVEKYEVTTKLSEYLPTNKEVEINPHYLLFLGRSFKPSHEVKNGKIYPRQHLWFHLDTVFTCDTIEQARNLTQERI